FGGEALIPVKLNQWKEKYPGAKLVNMYGITETTVHVTFKEIEDKDIELNISNIGTPIPTLTTYVMGKYIKLVPLGVTGELCVGGKGVGRGYLNRPELTKEKFVNNPYIPEQRLYRSGDLGRFLGNGEIEYLGRIDHQVKIRGYRIELGEIESELLNHDRIKEVVVVPGEDNSGDKYLCAYLVTHLKSTVNIAKLKEYLSRQLPDYMIPSYFVILEKLPLTSHGKVDFKALPGPEFKAGDEYVAPRNEIEQRLAEIWWEVLHISGIGIDDDFFHLGGHSLKATVLVSKIHKVFDVKTPLVEVFRRPTIRGLSEYIEDAIEERYISIEPAEEKEYYALSSAQQRLYFLHQMEEAGIAYNLPSVWGLDGSVDNIKLERTFKELIQRHESLRTSFEMVGEEAVQRVHREVQFEIECYHSLVNGDLSMVINNFIRPFDLSQAPLLRVGLIHTPPFGRPSQEGNFEEMHILMVDMHHIISDGVSTEVLLQDFTVLYSGEVLPEIMLQYKDYAQWQNREKESPGSLKQGQYWQKEFEAEIPVLDLPLDYVRPAVQSFEGSSLSFEIGRARTSGLKALSLEQEVTLYMVLLALYTIFLSKISNQEDIVIGAPIAGRRHGDLEKIIGMFVNTLALRHYPKGEKTFIEFIAEVKEKTLQAFENQEYQYEDLVEQVVVNRDVSRNPLFDVSFLLQNMEVSELAIPGLRLTPYENETVTSKFDLMLTGKEGEETLSFYFNYSTKLFKRETIDRFIRYFRNIISNVLEDRDRKISELTILEEEEKNQLLYDFNTTAEEYPKDKTIHELFEERVEKAPHYIAVVAEGAEPSVQSGERCCASSATCHAITYRELSEISNQLARKLRKEGVKSNTITGIMVGRSMEMVVGILAVLKAGGAYLPIEPGSPPERMKYIIKDSGIKLVLSQKFIGEQLEDLCEWIDLENKEVYTGTKNNPERRNGYGDLGYILYTSGSTGKPKGVMVEHGSMVNTLSALFREYWFSEKDTYLLKTPYIFDVSVAEIFGWFWGKGRLVVLEREGEKDPEKILNEIERHNITHINFVPSMFNAFIDNLNGQNNNKLSGLKYIFLAGEALLPQLVQKFKDIGSEILLENIYGPTEATIYATKFSLQGWNDKNKIPIGKPLDNVKIYILDKYYRLQPVKVPGELCIGGLGVARGYLNDPELTFERFINYKGGGASELPGIPNPKFQTPQKKETTTPTPHSPITPLPHHPIYLTGDLGRWQGDGNIEFLGRIDHQVKIRGFRVELGDIESHLSNHDNIGEAVVLAGVEGTGDQYLCAYIVSNIEFEVSGLRQYLSRDLPDYMIPTYFMQVKKIPLTLSGKIDRRALPAPELKAGEGYIAPRNAVEEKLAELWSEVLGVEKDIIGIDSNFFEWGGQSLKAVVLAAKMHKPFNVKVPLAEIFKMPTIRGLSRYIEAEEKERYISIEPAEEKEYYSLSSAQQRLYLLHQMDPESTAYNMPTTVMLEGGLEKAALKDTSGKLIHRHESLRTSFHMFADEPVQKIHREVEFDIEFYDMKEVDVRVEEELSPILEGTRGLAPLSIEPATRNSQPVAALISSFIRPFDLSQSPLLRVGLIRQEENKHILMTDMHHIVSDGTSMQVFIKEFISLYGGEELPSLRIQYRDFSQWRKSKKEQESINRQEQYWLSEFSEEIPVLNLPTDFARPLIQDFTGDTLTFEIGKEETEKLKHLGLTEGATLYMVLLVLINIFLAKISDQEGIVVGSPAAGRRHIDLEQMIGVFVNTLAMRNYPAGEKTFKEFLREARNNTLKAQENQDYPFEYLVEKAGVSRDASRNPLFDVMFVLQNMDILDIDIPGLRLKPYEYDNNVSRFDLTFYCEEKGDDLLFKVEYSTRLFRQDTIKRFIGYFKKIVSDILNNAGIRIKIWEIGIISEGEKRQILDEFNDTGAEYPKDKVLHALFEEQSEKTPDNIAVIGPAPGPGRKVYGVEDRRPVVTVTYRELNQQSLRLACGLRERGVEPDIIVGIMVERSLEMIIGILGILKSGGAYLPIDPEYPKDRINYILADSAAKILLTSDAIKRVPTPSHLHLSPAPVTEVSSSSTLTLTSTCQVSPANLAYVIYTSGSTGKPKGVMVEHESVINLLYALNKAYPFMESDVYLLKTSYVFDVSVTELLGWFPGGGRLSILEKDEEKEPEKILEVINRDHITHINFVPSMFNVFVEVLTPENINHLSGLKYIFLAGEALFPELVEKSGRLGRGLMLEKLENLYGPTEATVYASKYSLRDWKGSTNIAIGKPLGNTRLYILNRYHRLQGVGLAGELVIAGAGLARGYLNRPGLTAERFVRAVISSSLKTNDRLYKTGDLARWRCDGNIEFLGRMDQQVKIRGFRIEPGEIENQLLNHDNIKEAVVVPGEDGKGDKYLCAYIVGSKVFNQTAADSELREYLSNTLPGYMIPSFFIVLDKIPLTPGGKVDRKSLPEPAVRGNGLEFTAAGNVVEEKLVKMWSDVLLIDGDIISIHDNFFQLGGHSLKATRLISKIHQTFNVRVPLAEVFKRSTIRGLSQYISGEERERYIFIGPAEEKEYYLLSSAQKRLYLLQQMDLESTAYNMPTAVILEGVLEKAKLEDTFKRLIHRHESLRTSFHMVAEEPVQRIHEQMEFAIEYYDLATGDAGNTGEEKYKSQITNYKQIPNHKLQITNKKETKSHHSSFIIHHSFICPFDLSQAPLLRVGLIKIAEDEYILTVDMHHIISDGTSMQVFVKEFMSLYGGEALPYLRIQYRDFSQWQKSIKEQESIKRQEQYWFKEFAGETPILNLPLDFARSLIQDYTGDTLAFEIGKEETEKLKYLALTEEATFYMVLLALFNIFLSRISGREEIVVGSPTAGRRHTDLEPMIGVFVNTLVLKNYPAGEKTFKE
ncbi:MAG: amino acid adenylation domain-containing protein, partial [Candidatus Aminicenantes bacterium]